MPDPRPLKNPPITEALIDLRVKARSGFHPSEFERLKPQLAGRFPKAEESRGLRATLEIVKGEGKPPRMEDLGLQGYFFRDEGERTVAQFRIDGFTLNRLKPYTSWEQILPQAMELWHLYASVAKPDLVTRIAVRYINHISLPLGVIRTEDYLTAGPTIPPELPQGLSSFLTRVTIHDPTYNIAAHITQALETETEPQRLMILFDIDAYKQHDFLTEDSAIESLGLLRAFKNRIFFSSLTETALRQFQ